MKKLILHCLSILLFATNNLFAGLLPPRKNTYHVAPPSWFLGYTNPKLEIILHAENISLYNIVMTTYPGVTLRQCSTECEPTCLLPQTHH